jgi:hypothetical protein
LSMSNLLEDGRNRPSLPVHPVYSADGTGSS